MLLKRLDDTDLIDGFREDARYFSECGPMLRLVEALQARAYACELLASRSHNVLNFGTNTAQISVEHLRTPDRFRIRYFEMGRKMDSWALYTQSETLGIIDSLVIRAQLIDTPPKSP